MHRRRVLAETRVVNGNAYFAGSDMGDNLSVPTVLSILGRRADAGPDLRYQRHRAICYASCWSSAGASYSGFSRASP